MWFPCVGYIANDLVVSSLLYQQLVKLLQHLSKGGRRLTWYYHNIHIHITKVTIRLLGLHVSPWTVYQE